MIHLITILALAALADAAEHTVGNGGDILVCSDPKKNTVLDLYEAEVLRDEEIDLGDDSLGVYEKVQLAVNRLKDLDPALAARLTSWNESFEKESAFLEDVTFEDVNDSGYVVIPDSCKLRQAALQFQPKKPKESHYWIDQELWDSLDKNSKAGLVLHEIVYREALERGHQDSVSARYLTGWLASRSMEDTDAELYAETIRSIDYDRFQTIWPDYNDRDLRLFVLDKPIAYEQGSGKGPIRTADDYCKNRELGSRAVGYKYSSQQMNYPSESDGPDALLNHLVNRFGTDGVVSFFSYGACRRSDGSPASEWDCDPKDSSNKFERWKFSLTSSGFDSTTSAAAKDEEKLFVLCQAP